MPRVVRSNRAEADLSEIWLYIAADRPEAADRLLRVINEKLKLLSLSPEIGTARPDLAPRLRSFSAGSYVIFFRPLSDGIEVMRIVHGARDYTSLF